MTWQSTHNRAKSQKQEKMTAQRFGGRVQPGSGSRAHSKGDVKTSKLLIECKTTEKDAFRLTEGLLAKIEREAIMEGKTGVMCITLGSGRTVYVVPPHVIDVFNEEAK